MFSRAGEGGKFFCIDDANLAGEPLKCPGGYHTECPCGEDECPIGECECNGQLRIRSDCKYARSEGGTFNYSEELNDLDVAMTPQIWDTLNIIVTKDDIIRTLNYLRQSKSSYFSYFILG